MPLPLSAVRILDASHDWAGPHATRILADFGAEVIKVEYVRRMDGMRGGIKQEQRYNYHPRWWQLNRNKQSVTLNLRREEDRRHFEELVAVSDVVVESSRPGVMGGLGVGYERLVEIKPDIILVSMSAFGQTGPEAQYGGYGGGLEPLAGVQVLTAYEKGSEPMRIKEMDVTNGVVGACAVMTALIHRQVSGQGQWIDLSQLETACSGLIGEHLLEVAMNGSASLPRGNRHPRHAPQGCYRCLGDDRWLALVVRSSEEWQSLCRTIGRLGLAREDRFSTPEKRAEHHDEIDRYIEEWTSQRSHYEAMNALQAAGVPAGAVLTVDELPLDPHLRARGFFLDARDGSGRYPGMPFRLSTGDGEIRCRGPFLGEHNQQVLCDLLGKPVSVVRPIREEEIGTAFDPD